MLTIRFPKKRWQSILLVYLLLLLCSHILRWVNPYKTDIPDSYQIVRLAVAVGDTFTTDSINLAYIDLNKSDSLPVIVLIHGSPTGLGFGGFENLGPELAKQFRVVIPDLPGFVMSRFKVPDYSIRAHAQYLKQLMNYLQIKQAHFIGYSMGSGVIINLAEIAPDLVKSLDLLAGISVQELELFGNYYLNHAVHAVQLFALKLIEEAIPHFGYLDDIILSSHYARNFYDSDQRPLAGILKQYTKPMLIQHGKNDNLVPYEVALENQRLVPQSQLITYPYDHGMPFLHWQELAKDIIHFVNSVETGQAVTKATADLDRIQRSKQKINLEMPNFQGATLIVMFLLIVIATFISEDLTSIATGIAIANGTMDFVFGTVACFIGIYLGDLALYLLGRVFGRKALDKAPLRWWINKQKVLASQQWFEERGSIIIFISRFVPGTRLPTYVGAGMFGTNFWFFSFWFLIASAIWTPLLIIISMLLGEQLFAWFDSYSEYAIWLIIAVAFSIYFFIKIIKPFFTHKGRRLLLGKYRRLVNWEFWPMWFFYPPLIVYVLYLGIRFRSFTLFTLANPAIPEGGFVGESKFQILNNLNPDFVAKYRRILMEYSYEKRIKIVQQFMNDYKITFPIVLKPDKGERGESVQIIKNEQDCYRYLEHIKTDTLMQEYIDGLEFGVFYIRKPDAENGFIFSITDKQFTSVIGDGEKTLEQLIIEDDRAVCLAERFFIKHFSKLKEEPEKGEIIKLVEIGTHSKGALFLDGFYLKTVELEAKIDQISKQFNGFYFGRYDIRVPDIDDFKAGKNLKIIELNGVTSEATHIYDPKNSYRDAYSVLVKQWRHAFEIGAINRSNGLQPDGLLKMIRLALFRA